MIMDINLSSESTLQGGKYRIIKMLGKGGFGITYLAYHTLLNKNFAIKEFFPQDYCNRESDTSHVSVATASNKEFVGRLRRRFITEARNISALNHPNIITIHDVFEENGTAYYVMDHIEGVSLERTVETEGALPTDRAIDYICKIGDALEYLHSNNMAHYDVKPDNIMVRKSDDTPILIDFGLSKQYSQVGNAKSTMLVAMSHGYSPIEQYYQDGVTTFSPASDVYALGATLYRLLTGRIPPEAPKLLGETIELPLTIDPAMTKAVQWAMTSDVKKRCQTARQFTDALKRAQSVPPRHTDGGTQIANGMPEPKLKPDFNSQTQPREQEGRYHAESFEPTTSAPQKKNNTAIWVIASIGAFISILLIILIFQLSDGKETPQEAEETTQTEQTEITEITEITEQSQPTEQPEQTGQSGQTEQTAPTRQTIDNRQISGLKSGRNKLKGTFYFKGAEYGFTINLSYDATSGIISDATYEADGYAGVSKLGDVRYDGNTITVETPKTYIRARSTGDGDTYEGEMTRGDHRGTCRISLQ